MRLCAAQNRISVLTLRDAACSDTDNRSDDTELEQNTQQQAFLQLKIELPYYFTNIYNIQPANQHPGIILFFEEKYC